MTNIDHTKPATAHTPEPWRSEGFVIFNPASSLRKDAQDILGGQLAAVGGLGTKDKAEKLANARRIVAAVNACKGISTEALENGVVKELLASSIKFSDALRTNYSDAQLCLEERDAWRDAIEKATEGAV